MKKFSFFKIPKDLDEEIKKLKTKPASFWEKRGERSMLKLFDYTYRTVPAYKKFLKNNNVKASQIKSLKDFISLPILKKDNYLRKNDYNDLFSKKGGFADATTFSSTSGSSGEPFFFPRGREHDAKYEYMTDVFLKDQFDIDKKKTLAIMGFALGVWIGGIFTYKVLNKISEENKNLTVVPVGTNKDQFLDAIKKFGNLYDQIILMGYPPFIKDVLDESREYKINWRKHNVKILTAAEGYSENFRNYIAKKAVVDDKFNDIINMYGTVELGTMAHETAFSNLIRNIATKNKKVFNAIFPNATNIPTLAQYYPHMMHFEEVDGRIIASGFGSSIPLLRYDFSDMGGVIPFDEMIEKLKDAGIDILKEAKKYKIDKKILKLPFVWIYARSDLGVVFRGANIYADEIRVALLHKSISKFVTGRFTMMRKENKKIKQILEINVELKKDIKKTKEIKEKVLDTVIKELCKNNSEFNNEYTSTPSKATPKIVLHKYEDKKYFGRKGKQRWVKI